MFQEMFPAKSLGNFLSNISRVQQCPQKSTEKMLGTEGMDIRE